MNKRFGCVVVILFLCSILCAQSIGGVGGMPENGEYQTVASLGGGYTAMFDSYLSENRYTGFNIACSYENLYHRGKAKLFNHFEDEFLISLSRLTDQAKYSYSYALSFDAILKWDYKFFEDSKFTFYTGPGLATRLGVAYNPYNSNNPAQVKFFTMFAPHIAGVWRFKVADYPMALSVKSTIPLLGVTFAPAYGQLYYEMYKYDGYAKSIRFAWPFKMPVIYNDIALDFPVAGSLLRLSYNHNYSYCQYSNNTSAMNNHAFMIGVVRTLKELPYAK